MWGADLEKRDMTDAQVVCRLKHRLAARFRYRCRRAAVERVSADRYDDLIEQYHTGEPARSAEKNKKNERHDLSKRDRRHRPPSPRPCLYDHYHRPPTFRLAFKVPC